MGRFNLHVRPVYDEGELTGGERIARGIQTGLDWYAARREAARTEGNEVGSRGGVRLPDAPTPSIRQRIGGIGRRIGEVIHGSPGQPPVLQPTGTFAPTPPVANAVVDALRPMGVNDIRMPCTPERVFRAIQTAGKGGTTQPDAQPHFDTDAPNADPTAGSTQGGAQ